QLVLPLAAAVLLARSWKVLAGWAATGVALLGVTLALTRTGSSTGSATPARRCSLAAARSTYLTWASCCPSQRRPRPSQGSLSPRSRWSCCSPGGDATIYPPPPAS